MRYLVFFTACLLLFSSSKGQSLFVADPMTGYTELRTSKVWIEVAKDVDKVYIVWWEEAKQHNKKNAIQYNGELGKDFNPIIFTINGLEPATSYTYQIIASKKGQKEAKTGTIKTQEQWIRKKPAPDFSFLTGSCTYFNDYKYDYMGRTPYGGDSSIFITMAKTPADFMLWLGDNWYTRDVDNASKWGLWYRAQHVRSQPVLQRLLNAMPHYAIWDDHDFGPNNAGGAYIYKEESRKVFKKYWANPSYGMDSKGIYTQFNYSDVAYFLLDNRTWRSQDDLPDSINGEPNPNKLMFGKTQMDWLKNSLLQNKKATFKIIATGSQVLNTYSPFDCMYHFPIEWQELIDFISDNNIEGVVFLTGDRHRSEVIKLDRKDHYTLYDITCSPFTSHAYGLVDEEKDIPTRVPNTLVVEQRNFSKITVSGERRNRVLHVDYYSTSGVKLAEWEINEKDLQD